MIISSTTVLTDAKSSIASWSSSVAMGETVGSVVGRSIVGESVISFDEPVGDGDGLTVGASLGSAVGTDGATEGWNVGFVDGLVVGSDDGGFVGVVVGCGTGSYFG